MNQWGNMEGHQVIWERTPLHRISPICFHRIRLKKDKDNSSEAHLQISKTSRGSYIEPELYIFVKIFKFYFVTQSL
jgi:hypothetical protein